MIYFHVQSQDYMFTCFVINFIQGTVSGSIQATDRLMKELRDVYRSESFKTGLFYFIAFLKYFFLFFLIINSIVTKCFSQ